MCRETDSLHQGEGRDRDGTPREEKKPSEFPLGIPERGAGRAWTVFQSVRTERAKKPVAATLLSPWTLLRYASTGGAATPQIDDQAGERGDTECKISTEVSCLDMWPHIASWHGGGCTTTGAGRGTGRETVVGVGWKTRRDSLSPTAQSHETPQVSPLARVLPPRDWHPSGWPCGRRRRNLATTVPRSRFFHAV